MFFRPMYLIYPVLKQLKITLEPQAPVTVDETNRYTLCIRPFSGLRRYGLRNREYIPTCQDEAFFKQIHPLVISNGMLEITLTLPQEDCYLCELFVNEQSAEKFEIYALEDDLFALQPFKGDNHMHTWMSDGKDSPMYMAAAACRLGYDYCVITDHKRYEPSLIAKDFFEQTGVDFLVVPGEEVHSPDNPVHIINLGGTESVNDWWRDHEPEYRAAVEKELETMHDPMTDDDRYAAAASQVMFDKIRSVDGVAVLCHPHWILPKGFNETEDITDYLFDHKRFDALELIAGGAYEVGTQMQVSYYQERNKMPILGNSDAHGCFGGKLEPGNFTILYASELSPDALKAAIRKGNTVAGNENKLYGDYRLVKYAYFLLRNFYPEHRNQRDTLGIRMQRAASSLGQAEVDLTSIRPSTLFAELCYKNV
ncbi:MAG: hypothetical protein IJ354_08825 [Clostridia bacterium]|nr:hypothetical protein [Clostridia bacterium]